MPGILRHYQSSRRKSLTTLSYGAANERTYNAMLNTLGTLSELLGNRRSDVLTLEVDHKERTTDRKPILGVIERIGTKLFAAIPMNDLGESPIALPPTVIQGAVKKYTTSVPGVTLTTDLNTIERNNGVAINSNREVKNILKNDKAGSASKLYMFADIYYPSAKKVRETEHKIVVELYTICAVRKEILNYVHNAQDLTVPKTRAYANIAKGIVPFAMNHDLSFQGMTEAQINDPKWVAEQTKKLDESMRLLKRGYIATPDKRKHADKIAKKYSVTILKKHIHDLANG